MYGREIGSRKAYNPVVGVSWFEANAFCKWLLSDWENQTESQANPNLTPKLLRLPLEIEWLIAAGGNIPAGRYPWDLPGQITQNRKELLDRSNIYKKIGHTTPVNQYPDGISTFGVMDMTGNVWEWQANFSNEKQDTLSIRGGSWEDVPNLANVQIRLGMLPQEKYANLGFRVVVIPKLQITEDG